ncbi:uncharacterized protein IWZ02DRAFT_12047 [Phyllosticta citriasiana]|uniref:uncharacterized protein n=1 Tax=Phyllosticta citriasiana TaxID=595635 RepID=UPI0030FD233C
MVVCVGWKIALEKLLCSGFPFSLSAWAYIVPSVSDSRLFLYAFSLKARILERKEITNPTICLLLGTTRTGDMLFHQKPFRQTGPRQILSTRNSIWPCFILDCLASRTSADPCNKRLLLKFAQSRLQLQILRLKLTLSQFARVLFQPHPPLQQH